MAASKEEFNLLNIRDKDGKSYHLPEMHPDEQLEVEVDSICSAMIVEAVDVSTGKLKPKVVTFGKSRLTVRPKEAMKLLKKVEPDQELIKQAKNRIDIHFKKLKQKVEQENQSKPSHIVEEEWDVVRTKEIVIKHRSWTKEFIDLNGRSPGNLVSCTLVRQLGLRSTPENELKQHRTKIESGQEKSQSTDEKFLQLMEQNQKLLQLLTEKEAKGAK